MKRTFATDGVLVHDPAFGVTHRAPVPLPPGRIMLDDHETGAWPIVTSSEQDRCIPSNVCWSPIVRCNLHCPHCLDDTTVTPLDAAARARTGQILADSAVLGIDISGGEPLLLRDLPALLAILRSSGRNVVSMTSNGWHLARRAHELDAGLDAVRVSLDGPDAPRHDAIRGVASFERAIAGIQAAQEVGLPVQIQMVLMRRNQSDLQDMINLTAALGVRGITFLQMLPIGSGEHLGGEMLSDEQAQHQVNDLDVPAGIHVRIRTRAAAGAFTVIRADGRVWRNRPDALGISGLQPLTSTTDLTITGGRSHA